MLEKKKRKREKRFSNNSISAVLRTERYRNSLCLVAGGATIFRRRLAIFSLWDLGRMAGVPGSTVASLVMDERHRYREYAIPKRSGGVRTIAVPLPGLMAVQRVIKKQIVDPVEIHDCAVGFRPTFSIKNHVEKHVKERKFIKVDIKDCFPSIRFNKVINVFKNLEFTSEMSYCLARLATHNGALPQGAPTSPGICNIVLKHLDNRLSGRCQSPELNYTRYADDILVSGDGVDLGVFGSVVKCVKDCDFDVNSKTRMLINPNRIIVCGISISEGIMKLPKEKKRQTRSDAHFLVRNGIEQESLRGEALDPFYVDRVLGRLSFWEFVEPDAAFPKRYRSLIRKAYGELLQGE